MNKRQGVQVRSIAEGLLSLKDLPQSDECAEVRRLRDALAERNIVIDRIALEQFIAAEARTGLPISIEEARRDIRTRHLLPVARRAKRLFKHDPDVLKALRIPPARGTLEEHAAAALAMAKALRPHAKFCHAEKFRVGFITELKAAGTQLRARANVSASARHRLTVSTRELQEAIRDARELASLIDVEIAALGHVHRHMRTPEDTTIKVLADLWSKAHKLGKPIGRPKRRKGRPGPAA